MNILIITPAGKINGTAKTFNTWIKILHSKHHKVFLLSEVGNLAKWTENFCEKQLFFELDRFEPSVKRLLQIIKIVNRHRIDVIWGVGTTSSLIGSITGLICRKKYINILNVSPRNHVWPPNPKWKFPNIGHIITVSEKFSEVLIKDSGINKENIHFVPAQFDLDELKPVFPEFVNKNQRLIISLFRRFDKQKSLGVISFLEYIQENRKQLAHCKFNFFGAGDNELQITQLVQNLSTSGIEINNWGFVKDVQNEMVKSDIVIGSERVAIEAILCGRPVCILGEFGLINFVTPGNLNIFMNDNFSGLVFSRSNYLEENNIIKYFSNYEELLAICNPQHCYQEIAKKYNAENGIQELIYLCQSDIFPKNRIIYILRVIKAIITMYFSKFRIGFSKSKNNN